MSLHLPERWQAPVFLQSSSEVDTQRPSRALHELSIPQRTLLAQSSSCSLPVARWDYEKRSRIHDAFVASSALQPEYGEKNARWQRLRG
jgi:hypothetical protein